MTPAERKAARALRAAEAAVIAAEHAARLAKVRAIVATGRCPLCGAGLQRNTSMAGWWMCRQGGAESVRVRPADPPCPWQGFTE
jgi:Tfp pilus assembly protein PilX